MTFGKEMERFFRKYRPKAREAVETNLEYRLAANAEDVVRAQEIACRILEGEVSNAAERREAREDRWLRELVDPD